MGGGHVLVQVAIVAPLDLVAQGEQLALVCGDAEESLRAEPAERLESTEEGGQDEGKAEVREGFLRRRER